MGYEEGHRVTVPSRFEAGAREKGEVVKAELRPDGRVEYHVRLNAGGFTTAVEADVVQQ